MRIDLGGGKKPSDGCINMDMTSGEGIWRRRLQDGIPAGDRTVEYVHASHVLEHVPAGADRIGVFNEVWRVLADDGQFEVKVPLLINDAGLPEWRAIADPTHVSFWCRESFGYFDGAVPYDADYGIKPWRTMLYETRGEFEGHWIGTPAR
jgi:hypothetical protein